MSAPAKLSHLTNNPTVALLASPTNYVGRMVALQRLPAVLSTNDAAALAPWLGMHNDDRASEPCRITALRVAALHGAKEVLPVARELAQTGETEMLRMAAIASLGELGGAADQELLDALTHADVPYVASIATQAAATLKKRMVPTR